ncbi:DUF2062 domain-containing protein [Algivirga pacifica]|uniref:DUF2062 domain-containing protein n=1 Tax=Algivirga pacifica TaxID=1162670 RepID=A0ABP9DAJ4_9BACT
MEEQSSEKKPSFWERKVTQPLIGLLRQGISPHTLALSLSVGAAFGVFPIIGTSTVLCVVMAYFMRLNQVAIQLSNYLVYPVQLLLIIPFFQAGIFLLGGTDFAYTPEEMLTLLSDDLWGSLFLVWEVLLGAMFAWGVIMLPLCIFLYWGCRYLLKRIV